MTVQQNRQMLRDLTTRLDPFNTRFPNYSQYRRPWTRRWLDVAIRGFLVWYGVVVVGLAIVLMKGC